MDDEHNKIVGLEVRLDALTDRIENQSKLLSELEVRVEVLGTKLEEQSKSFIQFRNMSLAICAGLVSVMGGMITFYITAHMELSNYMHDTAGSIRILLDRQAEISQRSDINRQEMHDQIRDIQSDLKRHTELRQ